ncbi:hypothetical protein IW146_005846 [Coemansia sp. RSA 922]|nr:hypothetical protein IW146_005846 [Coemansia sp. RSA 922]
MSTSIQYPVTGTLEYLEKVAKVTRVNNKDGAALDRGHRMGKGEVYFAWDKAGKRIIVVTRGDPAGSDMDMPFYGECNDDDEEELRQLIEQAISKGIIQ